jgi:hypothetical protein
MASLRVIHADGFPSLADTTSWVWQLFGDGHRQPVGGSNSPAATTASGGTNTPDGGLLE